MPDYSEHVRILVFFIVGLVGLFIVGYTTRFDELSIASIFGIIVVAGVIAILARFGSDKPRAN